MDKCQSIRQYLLEHFSRPESHPEKKSRDLLDLSVEEHLLHCPTCRLFRADLTKIGEHLDSLETRITHQIQVPPLSDFETLINNYSRTPQTDSTVKSLIRGQTRPNRREFIEILVFLGTGVTLLSGIGLLLDAGLIIPVGILFGMISMLLPLMLLIEDKPQRMEPHQR